MKAAPGAVEREAARPKRPRRERIAPGTKTLISKTFTGKVFRAFNSGSHAKMVPPSMSVL